MNAPQTIRAKAALFSVIVVLITLVLYIDSLRNGFVDWDDYEYVVNNPFIKELSRQNVKAIFSTFYQATYNPFVFFSFAVEYSLFGLNPLWYHLDNIILHGINTLLVFWLIFFLSRDALISMTSSMLFGVHPLHVESVVWIAERKDMLSGLFFLCALLFYLYYKRENSPVFYFTAIIFFLFCLLSKPSGVALPVILICYEVFSLERKSWKILPNKIPFFVLSFVIGIIAYWAQKSGGGIDVEVSFSWIEKIFIVIYSLFFYIVKTFYPIHLSALYPYPAEINFFAPVSIVSFTAVVFFTAGVLFVIFRQRKESFYVLFFLVSILPMIKIIPFGNAIVADRFIYIPSIGLFALIGLLAKRVMCSDNTSRYRFNAFIIGSLAVALLFASLTYKRAKVWKSSQSLWSDVVKKNPGSSLAHFGLGNAYREAGNIKKAMAEYQRALSISPSYVDAFVNMGNCLNMLGRYKEAKAYFLKAFSYDTKNPRLLVHIAGAYQREGDFVKALDYYKRAENINPALAEIYAGRGRLYKQRGLLQDAVRALEKAVRLNPDSPYMHNELGMLYRKKGQPDEAIRCYEKAISLDPQFASAYNNLGWVYLQQGEYELSTQYFNDAIMLDPSMLIAYDNMVQAYLMQHNIDKAVAVYKKCFAANQDPASFKRLISLYFKLGMEDAILKECREQSKNPALSADSLLCLGDYYRKKGNLTEAEQEYRKALQETDRDPRIHFSFGMLLWEKGLIVDATKEIERAEALGLKTPETYTKLGILYFRQKMTGRAAEVFTKAVELNDILITPHLYLAEIFAQKHNKRQDAIYHLRKILEINPDYPQAQKVKDEIKRLAKKHE